MYNEKTTKKPLKIRMEIFNTQIFNIIFDNHSKDNVNMNYSYLEKAYNHLFKLAYYDDNISCNELENFRNKYNDNLQKLYFKKSGIIEKQYKELIDYLIKYGIKKVIDSELGD